MAAVEMPDVLTPQQMAKLGGAAHPDDLPDTLTPEQMDRATTKPTKYQPTEDEKLGIDSGMASPTGMVWDRHAREFRKASEIGKEQPLPLDFKAERPLVHEDPAMGVATTIAGAGAGRLVGAGVSKLSPILAKIVEPAVAGGVTSALQGGDARTNLKAAGIAGAMGVPGAAFQLVRGAPAAVAERLPTAVTGGLKTKAAKQVVAGDVTADVLDAHPELKKVLATGDVGDKFNATGRTLDTLTRENDKVYDAIQAQHQGVPLDPVVAKVKKVAEQAHAAGDETLENAANSAVDNLSRFADVADKRGPVMTATQLRGVRNNLAKRVQAVNPTLGPTDVQAAADEIKRAINDGIEEIAGKTKGVDVAALKTRNQHIAALMPVQRTLREQAVAKNLLGPEDRLADFITHPRHEIAGLIRKGPAHADAALAASPAAQRLAAAAGNVSLEPITKRLLGRSAGALPGLADTGAMGTGAASAARGSRRQANDLEYAAKVSQLMQEGGMSLHDAVEKASEE